MALGSARDRGKNYYSIIGKNARFEVLDWISLQKKTSYKLRIA